MDGCVYCVDSLPAWALTRSGLAVKSAKLCALPSWDIPMPHAVSRLRDERLARSKKPFLARGASLVRCERCRVGAAYCMCAVSGATAVVPSMNPSRVQLRRYAIHGCACHSNSPARTESFVLSASLLHCSCLD